MKRNKGFTLVELLASMALLALIVLMVFVIFGQSTKVTRQATARVDQFIAARTVLEQMAREIRGAVLMNSFAGPDASSTAKRMGFVVLHAGGPDENLQGWRDSAKEKEQKCSDQIYFVAPVENSGKQDYCLIGYWVQDNNGDTPAAAKDYDRNSRQYINVSNHNDDVLMRYFVTDGGNTPPDGDWANMNFGTPTGAGNSNEFALNVKSLRIRCWSDYPDNNDFTTIWEDENNSPAVGNMESKVNWDTSYNGLTPGKYDDGRLPKAVMITVVVQDENNTEKEREFSIVVYLDNAAR